MTPESSAYRESADALALDPGLEFREDLAARFKSELDPGERLLRVGPAGRKAPSQGGDLRRLVLFAIAFSIIPAVCLTLDIRGVFPRIDGFLAIVGLLAGIFGLLCFVGAVASWLSNLAEGGAARGSMYALTNRRALIRKPRRGTRATEVHTIKAGTVRNIHRVEYPDGSGDVILTVDSQDWMTPTAFEGVAEVRRIEDLARRVLLHSDRATE